MSGIAVFVDSDVIVIFANLSLEQLTVSHSSVNNITRTLFHLCILFLLLLLLLMRLYYRYERNLIRVDAHRFLGGDSSLGLRESFLEVIGLRAVCVVFALASVLDFE